MTEDRDAALLAKFDALIRERDLFRWALDRYGKHDPACGDNQGSCSCGLREAEGGGRPPWRDPIGEGLTAMEDKLTADRRALVEAAVRAGYEMRKVYAMTRTEPMEGNWTAEVDRILREHERAT